MRVCLILVLYILICFPNRTLTIENRHKSLATALDGVARDLCQHFLFAINVGLNVRFLSLFCS